MPSIEILVMSCQRHLYSFNTENIRNYKNSFSTERVNLEKKTVLRGASLIPRCYCKALLDGTFRYKYFMNRLDGGIIHTSYFKN